MKKSIIAMAAGMGSRFGGLKQAAKFGDAQKTMLDFSIEDAISFGFNKIVFVIRRDIEKIFRQEVSGKYENSLDVGYVFQDEHAKLPIGRTKPWGTGHAVLSCMESINEPFLAINADDFYGRSVYSDSSKFLEKKQPNVCALAGYLLKNTLSKNGGVSRGICTADTELNLQNVAEFSGLEISQNSPIKIKSNEGTFFNGQEFTSLNFWSFPKEFMQILGEYFDSFMSLNSNSPKAEFYLPAAVDTAIKQNILKAKILPTDEKWQGVTYRQDMQTVEDFLKSANRI